MKELSLIVKYLFVRSVNWIIAFNIFLMFDMSCLVGFNSHLRIYGPSCLYAAASTIYDIMLMQKNYSGGLDSILGVVVKKE